jgi:hypothetical protein
MRIAVCTGVVAFLLYFFNDGCELWIAVKPAGKKEGCFYPVLAQGGKNSFSAFGIFISCKNN